MPNSLRKLLGLILITTTKTLCSPHLPANNVERTVHYRNDPTGSSEGTGENYNLYSIVKATFEHNLTNRPSPNIVPKAKFPVYPSRKLLATMDSASPPFPPSEENCDNCSVTADILSTTPGFRDVNLTHWNESYEDYLNQIEEFIFPRTWTWILIFIHSLVFVIGLVGNTLVCVAVYRNHSMRTVTNYFIVNLAVADFMVILFCLPPTLIWDVTMTWFFGVTMCKIVLYLQVSYLIIFDPIFKSYISDTHYITGCSNQVIT